LQLGKGFQWQLAKANKSRLGGKTVQVSERKVLQPLQ